MLIRPQKLGETSFCMFRCKQKWQKFFDWKGWKWGYYLLLLFAIFIAILLISDIFYVVDVLTKTSAEIRAERGASIPIGAECCWEYHSKPNFLAYYIFQNIVVLSIIFFSLKPKRFFYRCSVILPILILVIYRLIFPVNL